MTRDDVKKAFPEATDEQVKTLMDIHGADIERTKAQAGADAQRAEALAKELKAAQETIGEMEKQKGDAEKLQEEINRYREQEAKREKDAQEAKAKEEIRARFDAVTGERKFVHDFVKQGVFSEFEKAVCNQENAGKGDAAIFDALTKDKDYFASMNPPGAPGMGGVSQTVADDSAVRAIMGLRKNNG